MRIIQLGDKDFEKTEYWIAEAGKEAKKSLCLRSKCGTKIVKNNIVLGSGHNSPPRNKKLEVCLKDFLPEDFKSDRTCCIHAEQRAIVDALHRYIKKEIDGSTLYFARINGDKHIVPAGKPYCTICSKFALDNGIAKWVLLHDFGFTEYDADEYNEISFGRLPWEEPKNL
jgi:deoxycytidylate deaminase